MRPSSLPRARAFSAALALSVAHAAAASPNLVVNGDFDHDLAAWVRVGSVANSLWVPDDAEGDPGSGSLWARTREFSGGLEVVRRQCVPLDVPSRFYAIGARLRRDTESTFGGDVFAGFIFFDAKACMGELLAIGEITTGALDWGHEVQGIVIRDVEPAPKSVEVILGVSKDAQGEGEVAGNIDEVFVRVDGLLRDGFDGAPPPPL